MRTFPDWFIFTDIVLTENHINPNLHIAFTLADWIWNLWTVSTEQASGNKEFLWRSADTLLSLIQSETEMGGVYVDARCFFWNLSGQLWHNTSACPLFEIDCKRIKREIFASTNLDQCVYIYCSCNYQRGFK